MNRWGMSDAQVARDESMHKVTVGTTGDALVTLFGEPTEQDGLHRFAGTRQDLLVQLDDAGVVSEVSIELAPASVRRRYCRWGVSAFPAVEGVGPGVAYGGMDVLVIPRGSAHAREAFEFIAFIQRQDIMEKLNAMHCKGSPLVNVSESFFAQHPSPYIEVFDALASGPGARTLPVLPNWPEVVDELFVLAERVNLDPSELETALDEQASRAEKKLAERLRIRALRAQDTEGQP